MGNMTFLSVKKASELLFETEFWLLYPKLKMEANEDPEPV